MESALALRPIAFLPLEPPFARRASRRRTVMDLRIVRLVFAKEIRDILRDRRSLFVMVVLPILLYPVLLIGYSQLMAVQNSRLRAQAGRVALYGAEHAPVLAARIAADPAFAIAGSGEHRAPANRAEAEEWLRRGELDLVMAFPERFEARLASGVSVNWGRDGSAALLRNSARERSRVAFAAAGALIDSASAEIRAARMRALADASGIRDLAAHLEPIRTSWGDVASESDRAGFLAGRLLPFVILVMILSGAFFCALDISAGEKERGTLETLLVTPAARRDIVAGKLMTVLAVATVSALLNVLSLALTISAAVPSIGGVQAGAAAAGLSFSLSLGQTLALAAVVVPAASLFSAVSLGLSAFAKTYKEGQYYLSPVLLVAMPLSLVAALPGTSLDQLTALVPVANVSLAIKAIVSESAPAMWILLTIAVNLACTVYAIRWTVGLFAREDVLFRDAPIGLGLRFWRRGGTDVNAPVAPTRLHSVHAIALIAAIFAGGAITGGAVRNALGTVGLVVFQAVVLYGGLTVALTLATGNRLAHVLPLRGRPLHILTPLLAVPALVYLVMILLLASGALWPETAEAMRRTTEAYVTTTRGLGAAGTVLLLAVMPGICEELVFRGLVFRALRNYRGPAATVFLSAALFVVVHDPAQWAYVFTMGLVLGFVRERSRSIGATMLLHAAFNTAVLAAAHPDSPVRLPEGTPEAGELALTGAVALAMVAAFMALYARITEGTARGEERA